MSAPDSEAGRNIPFPRPRITVRIWRECTRLGFVGHRVEVGELARQAKRV